jgi:hypothetical protein
MSVKHSPKKDSSDRNQENQPRREAESYTEGQQPQSAQKSKDQPPFAQTKTDAFPDKN